MVDYAGFILSDNHPSRSIKSPPMHHIPTLVQVQYNTRRFQKQVLSGSRTRMYKVRVKKVLDEIIWKDCSKIGVVALKEF